MNILPAVVRIAATPDARPSGEDDPYGAFLPGERDRRAPAPNGPLSTLSFAAQDLLDVEGVVTGAGNPGWAAAHHPALQSAAAVQTCLDAGAALAGKTVTDELGFSLEGSNPYYGAPINPRDPGALTGGAASGSAAAVAGGVVDFALCVDTAGSARIPAAFCRIWGMRPSTGRIPTDGVTPFAPSFDTVGWMASDPEVMRAVGAALLGDDDDPVPLTDLRLAQDTLEIVAPALADVARAHAEAWGAGPPMRAFAGLWHDHLRLYAHAQSADISAGIGREVSRIAPRLGPMTAQRFASAMAAEPDIALAWGGYRRAARNWFDLTMPPGRVMILPTTAVARLDRETEQPVLSDFYIKSLAIMAIAGAVGAPQIHIPTPGGGVSLIARRGADRMLIERAIELAGDLAG
jgi:amidase